MPHSLAFAIFLCLLPSTIFAADWPQFRGPKTGQAVGEESLPTEIGPDKHLLWKTALPPGHSSPAIVGQRIFLTGVREKQHLETLCLDRASGEILWRATAPTRTLEKIHAIGSYAQSSPAADQERVVVFFGSSGLHCYNHAGQLLWQQPMGPFNDEFGAASSPIIDGDQVVLCQDHDAGSFLAAYDKRTGEQRWLTDRKEFSRGYCTPLVWTVEGKRQIVVAGTLRVTGYDGETGKELWTVRGLSRVNCLTPAIGPDNTLIVAGWSAGAEPGERISLEPFAEYAAKNDANANGTLEVTEVAASVGLKTRFVQCDRDKDGHITSAEYDDFQLLFDKSQNVVLAIRPGGSGELTDSHVLWTFERFIPFCASPLAYQGRVYLVKDGGILTALNAASGKVLKTGRLTAAGNYYSSPVAGDDKLYLLSQKGVLSVVSTTDSWKVLHSADFGEEGYATPAIVEGRIYLRTSGHLYCFGMTGAE